MTPITRMTTAALAAIALLFMAASGPDELQAEQDVADYKAALTDGGASLRKEFDRVAAWTKSGDLVCRAQASVVARGGQP